MGGSTEHSSTYPYKTFMPGKGGEAENHGKPLCLRHTEWAHVGWLGRAPLGKSQESRA